MTTLRSFHYQIRTLYVTLQATLLALSIVAVVFIFMGGNIALVTLVISFIGFLMLPMAFSISSFSSYLNMAMSMGSGRKEFFWGVLYTTPVVSLIALLPTTATLLIFPELASLNLFSLYPLMISYSLFLSSFGHLMGILTNLYGRIFTFVFSLFLGGATGLCGAFLGGSLTSNTSYLGKFASQIVASLTSSLWFIAIPLSFAVIFQIAIYFLIQKTSVR